MYRLGAIIVLCVAFFSPFVCYASEQGNEDVQQEGTVPHIWAIRKGDLKKVEPIQSNSPRYESSGESPRTSREDPVLNRRSGSKKIQPPQLVPKEEDANKE